MATSASTISREEVSSLVRQIQGNQLLNRQLSSVCQVNGLKSTGVKAELQRRIVDLIQGTVSANDWSGFQQVRSSITNAILQRSSPSSKNNNARGNAPFISTAQFMPPAKSLNTGANVYQQRDSQGSSAINSRPPGLPTFRPSPFYHVEAPIGKTRTCEVMSQHRNTINISMRMCDFPELAKCIGNKSYRVMIFCASDASESQHVTFPHQSELKVNSDEVKANLRGLKNKPGSTRPVDITHLLRLRPLYVNTIEFTYALTYKKFYFVVNLCKVTTVSELVTDISNRRRIPKASVVAELNEKAQDPDVVATSQVLSLKCPITYMRLDVPCRSLSCTHIQCFDATSYLQLQEQGPQWLCPICNKSAPFEQLAVDEYVRDIITNTSKDLETAVIEPNGRWSTKTLTEQAAKGTAFEDDDELEISEINVIPQRLETPKTHAPIIGTPASTGRDSTASASRAGTYSAKRPASAVIDLTLSSDDDDDDEPTRRPRKRQNTTADGSNHSKGMEHLSDSPSGYQSR
ncbi:hypothetical protein E4U30_001878 [Claviceps sp. LM220 group G6]|nr:hypothetical protein E4U15_005449 [Claviceps sp. LM218 group G6]KAG6095961.1 hypothetical protein E4U30_001878 [Claviceps sp. LM220 group G6]KAG6111656.1 hypothetical protein E4U31_004107 [Claviceps sp. LM219 group G6]KAG6119105.1 hypothetical protein E4U14_005909 [Claviceps sp. LM454 group G7]